MLLYYCYYYYKQVVGKVFVYDMKTCVSRTHSSTYFFGIKLGLVFSFSPRLLDPQKLLNRKLLHCNNSGMTVVLFSFCCCMWHVTLYVPIQEAYLRIYKISNTDSLKVCLLYAIFYFIVLCVRILVQQICRPIAMTVDRSGCRETRNFFVFCILQ